MPVPNVREESKAAGEDHMSKLKMPVGFVDVTSQTRGTVIAIVGVGASSAQMSAR